MLKWKKDRLAFTLIELLVVVIIVAVLAAVGVPLLSANVQRARASEAESGLGTWRTGIRALLSENNGTFPASAQLTLAQVGLNLIDLNGRWFDTGAYTAPTVVAGASTYCVGVDGNASGAPRADQVSGTNNRIRRSINQDGTLFDLANCSGNQLN